MCRPLVCDHEFGDSISGVMGPSGGFVATGSNQQMSLMGRLLKAVPGRSTSADVCRADIRGIAGAPATMPVQLRWCR